MGYSLSFSVTLLFLSAEMKTWGYFGNADVQGEDSEELVGTGDELFLLLDVKVTNLRHIVAWNFYTFTVSGWLHGGGWVNGGLGGHIIAWNFYTFTVGGWVAARGRWLHGGRWAHRRVGGHIIARNFYTFTVSG